MSNISAPELESINGLFKGVIADKIIFSNNNFPALISANEVFESVHANIISVANSSYPIAKEFQGTYSNCTANIIEMQGFNAPMAKHVDKMFCGCHAQEIIAPQFGENGTIISMNDFLNHAEVVKIDLSGLNTENTLEMNRAWKDCHTKFLGIKSLDLSNVAGVDETFSGCNSMIIDLSDFKNLGRGNQAMQALMDISSERTYVADSRVANIVAVAVGHATIVGKPWTEEDNKEVESLLAEASSKLTELTQEDRPFYKFSYPDKHISPEYDETITADEKVENESSRHVADDYEVSF